MTEPAVARAVLLLDAGRYADGLRSLAGHLASSPDDATALCLAARAHLGLEQPAEALGAAARACALQPDSEWPIRLISVAQMQLGRYPEARQAAAAARALAPQSWRAHLQLAQVDAMSGKACWSQSWSAANEAVRLAPDEAETHRVVGSVALALGDLPRAELALRNALRIDPHDTVSQHELARLHLRQRKLGQAAAGFAAVAAQDPSMRVAVRNLTVVVARALRIVHLILWGGVYVAIRAGAVSGSGAPGLRLIAVGVAVAAIAVFTLLLYRQTGRAGLKLLRSALRVDRWLAVWAGCLLIAFVGLLVAVGGAVFTIAGCAMAVAALVAGTVASWIRVRRSKSTVRR